MQIQVTASDANNIICQVTPTPTQTVTIDRGVAGNGIVSIVPVTIDTLEYLRITYTNGTVSDVGPITSTAYTATSPINIVGNTISLLTVPVNFGGTGATTAAAGIQNLLPSYTGNGNKRLGLNSGATALEWVADGGGTVTSVSGAGTVSGLTLTGTVTTSGSLTLGGTLDLSAYNGAGAFTTLSASGDVTLSGGTANGVTYLNGSKVLTSGSALTFDGTNLGVGTASPSAPAHVVSGSVAYPVRVQTTAGTTAGIEFQDPTTGTNRPNIASRGINLAFEVNSTEQMRLTSTGLGIGTSSPTAKLTVDGGAHIRGYTAPNTSFASLVLGITGGEAFLQPYTTGLAQIPLNLEGSNIKLNTGGATRATLDSSGNLGLGVTPSAWGGSYKTFQLPGGSIGAFSTGAITTFQNAYDSGAGSYVYSATAAASRYTQSQGLHQWYTAPSGTAGDNISFTQAMTLDASGNLGIGNTTPTTGLIPGLVIGNGTDNKGITLFGTSTTQQNIAFTDTANTQQGLIQYDHGGDYMRFFTAATERARITSGGDLLVGTTSGSNNSIRKGGLSTGQTILGVGPTAGESHRFNQADTAGANAAATTYSLDKVGSTNRSINAAGTVNASGADYAEYMTKASDFVVAKGDVVGIDAQGKLTNIFALAISFCVKSTDPSYVGGDSWGAGFEDDAEGLEAARQKVDRIAFAGQVPVNVMGATSGQYIVPVNDNGAIKGIAKNENDMTLAEYMKAVGKVISIDADGRARIIVKVV